MEDFPGDLSKILNYRNGGTYNGGTYNGGTFTVCYCLSFISK